MSWERERESVGAQAAYKHVAIESSESEGVDKLLMTNDKEKS
jgi:hypothetical protein